MDQQPQSRAPLIIAAMLLLLPVLYAGSYFALVVPGGFPRDRGQHYRIDRKGLEQVFWPLEQMDRKVRPGWTPHDPYR
jgi:hypothetical protein